MKREENSLDFIKAQIRGRIALGDAFVPVSKTKKTSPKNSAVSEQNSVSAPLPQSTVKPMIVKSFKKAPGKSAVHSDKRERMLALFNEVMPCMKCQELAEGRHKVVFGAGNVESPLVFVGEAPGAEEDRQGLPFVGRAGKLLTKMIEGMGLSREEIFICNVLKCRPPGNRKPLVNEVENCEGYLLRQLEIIQPKYICTLGTTASQALLKTEDPISQLRGRFFDYHGTPLMPTYHPAYLLRNPKEKVKVWADLQLLMKGLGLPVPKQ